MVSFTAPASAKSESDAQNFYEWELNLGYDDFFCGDGQWIW